MVKGKTCNRCGEWKELVCFARNSSSRDGYYSICKSCRAVTAKKYRSQPEVKVKEKIRQDKRYQENKPEILAKHKLRRSAEPERQKTMRDAYLAQPGQREVHRTRCRNWAKRNPEKMRMIVRNRRAVKLSAEGSHTEADIQQILENQDGQCVYCHVEVKGDFHVDHIQPLSRGGSNGPENLQITCPLCNRMKGGKTDWQFDRERYEQLRAAK